MTPSDQNMPAAGDLPAVGRSDPPIYQVLLWPNRSLSARGFWLLMAGAGVMLALPVIVFLGSAVALAVAPFSIGAFALLWWFLMRNYRDGRLTEELTLWPDLIVVERREPDGAARRWEANPYWVKLKLDPEGRPENYLTLRGGGRRIELGAFLSPEERAELAGDLETALRKANATHPDTMHPDFTDRGA